MPVKNIIPGQTVAKEKLQRTRELRRDMTPAEKALWQQLRANKLGVHFRRQQIIAGFIVDFYCHKAALVIEVDGDIHDLQQEEDASPLRLRHLPQIRQSKVSINIKSPNVVFGGGRVGDRWD
jgi:very-short-patch-repair endonuclease